MLLSISNRNSGRRSSKSRSVSNVRTSLSDGMFSDNESDDMNEDESEDSERSEAAKSPRKPKTPKISTSRKSLPSPRRLTKPAKKSSVQVGTSTFHIVKSSNPKSRRSKWSLRILARKVLFEEDRNSLLEKLLNCDDESSLRKICQELIKIQRDNSIACEMMLINLMFRVVGGTPSSYLPEDCELEEMGNDDWARVITDLVDDMRYCAPDYVLLCADPDGASPTKSASLSTALHQFRELYTKFWFTLSQLALEDSTGRFEIEMVRNWLNRTHELTLVAQPDIRAASVLASLQISLGVLDRTISLRSREVTQERQCKCSSGKKKEQLQNSVDGLRRNRQDLEEIVNSTFSTVFMSRYRDSNPFIRAENIMALSNMIIMRPDIYLSDKYLKYIGWTLSDKESCVRKASLLALTAPFGSKAIDLSAMSNVIRRFLPRLADCTIDVDINIQEIAMSLFLQLDRANFLEDFEDDSLWAQINNRALASDASPQVRRDALQFILNQLEAFDYDEIGHGSDKNWTKSKKASLVQSTNKNASKQLSTLAGW
jgi:cohesin complex subunit SA-1/2